MEASLIAAAQTSGPDAHSTASAFAAPLPLSWSSCLLSGLHLVTSQAYHCLFKTLSLTVGSAETPLTGSLGQGKISVGNSAWELIHALTRAAVQQLVTLGSAASCKCSPPHPPPLYFPPQYLLHVLWNLYSRTVLSSMGQATCVIFRFLVDTFF